MMQLRKHFYYMEKPELLMHWLLLTAVQGGSQTHSCPSFARVITVCL